MKEFKEEVRKEYDSIAKYTIRAKWFKWLNMGLVTVSMFWLGFYVAYNHAPQLIFDLMVKLV